MNSNPNIPLSLYSSYDHGSTKDNEASSPFTISATHPSHHPNLTSLGFLISMPYNPKPQASYLSPQLPDKTIQQNCEPPKSPLNQVRKLLVLQRLRPKHTHQPKNKLPRNCLLLTSPPQPLDNAFLARRSFSTAEHLSFTFLPSQTLRQQKPPFLSNSPSNLSPRPYPRIPKRQTPSNHLNHSQGNLILPPTCVHIYT